MDDFKVVFFLNNNFAKFFFINNFLFLICLKDMQNGDRYS